MYDSYDIFMADLNGKIVKQLTNAKGYDAEATLSPDGKKMIYTSDKEGDIDLYIMDLKTGKEKRVTNTLGYDGGAWFSPDGKKIIWRASRPKTETEIKEYKELLAENLVAPTNMEVFVANADGSNVKQVTAFGQATGRRHLCLTASGSFLHPIMNTKEDFLLIFIRSMKMDQICTK